MPVPVLTSSSSPLRLTPEAFTPESFAPYGTAVISPLPDHLTHGPPPLDSLRHSQQHSSLTPVLANQSSALKYSPISPVDNEYPNRCPSGQPESARMSLFACFSRELRAAGVSSPTTGFFDVRILERHPYTTQTFIPFNSTDGHHDQTEPLYLVIVAPSLKNQTATATLPNTTTGKPETVTIADPPDLSKVKAFVARREQAVTYGAGTWHAPMVVLGQRRLDFLVVQFANGVGDEDVQEVEFGEGIEVQVEGAGGQRTARL